MLKLLIPLAAVAVVASVQPGHAQQGPGRGAESPGGHIEPFSRARDPYQRRPRLKNEGCICVISRGGREVCKVRVRADRGYMYRICRPNS